MVEPTASAAPRGRVGRPWNIVLPIAFAIGGASAILDVLIEPRLFGSHAWIYTDAARAWLSGGDPWLTGPPADLFAGPPPMLLPFVPFVALPSQLIAIMGVLVAAASLVWLLVKLGLPGYWIGFLPFAGVVVLGHFEVPVVLLLLYGGRFAGLATLVKPYTAFALLAQQRWTALAVAIIAVVVTAPLLPWAQFFEDRDFIATSLARQYGGDSVFGNPLLVGVAGVALLSLGWRRAFWIGAPVLWPFAQQSYKIMAVPLMTPVLATFWALPIPGATVLGIVAQALLERVAGRRSLPAWLCTGIEPLTGLGASIWPALPVLLRPTGHAVSEPAATVA